MAEVISPKQASQIAAHKLYQIKPKFHLARHVTSGLDTTRHHTFDYRVVSRRDEPSGISALVLLGRSLYTLRMITQAPLPKCGIDNTSHEKNQTFTCAVQ